METELIRVDPREPDQGVIEKAGRILRDGGLVAFPTETVYGLGGNGPDAASSAKIYRAKGRPSDNPLIIHIARMQDLDRVAAQVPEAARILARAFWPGPLTMIFPKAREVPYETTGGLESVAVRMPDHPVALALIRAAGGFVAAPSANRSGRPSPTLAAHVAEDLGGGIDLILDGGMVGIGLESTIVDLTGPTPMILRPGAVSRKMLRAHIKEVEMDPGLEEGEESKTPPKAPGMRYRHYAPQAPLMIVEGERMDVASYINRSIREKGQQAGILACAENVGLYPDGLVKCIGSREKEETIALHLYQALREFDQEDVTCIYSEAFDTPRMGHAIMNRLLKAAGHQVVKVSEGGDIPAN